VPGGWFSNRQDVELWLLKQRKVMTEADKGSGDEPTVN